MRDPKIGVFVKKNSKDKQVECSGRKMEEKIHLVEAPDHKKFVNAIFSLVRGMNR